MRNDSNNSVFCRTPLGAHKDRHCVVMEAWTGAWLPSGCSATVKVKAWTGRSPVRGFPISLVGAMF